MNKMSVGGQAGYFLYYDDIFIPDYSDHYPVMKFDENEVITEVCDGKKDSRFDE